MNESFSVYSELNQLK